MIVQSLAEIIQDLQIETRKQYGEDFHVSETSDWYRENFPIAMGLKLLQDKLQDASDNMKLRTASDPYFFSNASNYLFFRKMPSKAKGYCKTYDSLIGATAKAGEIKLKKSGTDLIYTNTEDIAIYSLPFEFEIESFETGEIQNAGIGEITQLVSSPPNWKTFSNSTEIAGGQDLETLEEARKRYFNNGFSLAYWNISGIKAEILKVDGVKSVFAKANNKDETIDGQPRRSLWCVVEGGRDKDIAEAIFRKFTDATFTYGSVRVKVKDIQGKEVDIGFDRPNRIEVEVNIDVLGIEETIKFKDYMKSYFDNIEVGGVVSSSQALKYIPDYADYDYINITFRKQGTENFVSYIQLGNTDKAVYKE